MLVLVGCATESSPVEKCDDLVDVLCSRGVQCLGGSHSECVQGVKSELPCGSARSVSASYDRCVEQLQTNSCAALFPTNPSTGQPEIRLPADCMSVILTREAPASLPMSPLDEALVAPAP
jgi:hypothetical protein